MDTNIFEEFESLDTAVWVSSIKKYLKDKPYESLQHKIGDEIEIEPFYRKDDLNGNEAMPILGHNQWLIAASFNVEANDSSYLSKVRADILDALAGGANALQLQINTGTAELLPILLEGVYLNMVHLHIEGSALGIDPLSWVETLASLDGATNAVGSLALAKWDVEVVKKALIQLPKWSFGNIIVADSEQVSTAIASALGEASNWIAELMDAGISLATAQQQIRFVVNLTDDYFLSIARLRALKRLWLALMEAFGAIDVVQWPKIHVRTSYDQSDKPYWNMIAATTQALSAAVAQVYSLEVVPVAGEQLSPAFANRIARNIQHLLKMESHIDNIIDPSAGSYYVERYTKAIAEKAWFLFVASNRK